MSELPQLPHVHRVNVCAIIYRMEVIEDGTAVVFSIDRHYYGEVHARITFGYRSHLWYLTDVIGEVPVCHIVRMSALISEHVHGDHRDA